MRIACLHIPQYALQCATRVDPSLRRSQPAATGSGAAIAMVDAGSSTWSSARIAAGSGPLHAPVVVACSRAAWALGVRLGMTATAARSISADVAVVAVDAATERETVRAIADALLGLTPVVDLGGRVGAGGAHLAMYAEVPQKMRGHSFGERALERLAELGLTGRIGIADDRFTAWVAAAYGVDAPASSPEARAQDHGVVTMVPRGGSAAFLAPRPLSLLAISPEVQHMLEALGVTSLGAFASLPAPSVARPVEADYQALARGEGGTTLRPYAP
jgi:protein ImuB